MMLCRKCNSTGTVIIRKEYCYCNDCFNTYIQHKFRACIGKNKTLSNDKVLICLSGDIKSTVLLDLIHYGVSLNNQKKLRLFPCFLHIIENDTEEEKKIATAIIEQCKAYDYEVLVAKMDDYSQITEFVPKVMPNLNITTKSDLNKKLKQNVFAKFAKEMKCKIIFTAETTTSLASRLLSNIAIGRGSQVESDTGFVDNRIEGVKFLRPMRDITNEEIEQYIKIKKLIPSDTRIDKKNSLQAVIKGFVLDLQEHYPATVSTICKTADKIGSNENTGIHMKCVICQSTFEVQKSSVTALDATIFSREVSFREAGEENITNLIGCENKDSMFPYIFEKLCYCCSRNYAELLNYKQKPNI